MDHQPVQSNSHDLLDGVSFLPQAVSPRIQAWIEIEPKLPRRRTEVWRAINNQPSGEATIDEIERLLGWRINRISGRVTELARTGWVIDSGKRRDGQTVWRTAQGRTERIGARDRLNRRAGEVKAMRLVHDLEGREFMDITIQMEPGIRPVEGTRVTVAWRGAAEENDH